MSRTNPKEVCGNCDYGIPVKEGIVKCIRFPPTFVTRQMQNERGISMVTGTDFPVTGKDNWCGEWKEQLIILVPGVKQ